MIRAKDVKNCRVVIRDKKTNMLLADTLIQSWDLERNTIRIDASSLSPKFEYLEQREARVSVLVMHSGELFEFDGVLRDSMIANLREIALSKRREREFRKDTRYKIDVDGIVEGMVFYNQKVMLRKPIWVRTENISKSGLLIRTLSRSFEIGDVFTLLLEIQGTQVRNTYQIVRKQNKGEWQEAYGCKRVIKSH